MIFGTGGFILLSLGVVAAGLIVFADLIKNKIAKTGDFLDKLVMRKGYIGIALVILGVWRLFHLFSNFGNMFKLVTGIKNVSDSAMPTMFFAYLICIAVALLLGSLLAMDIIKKKKNLSGEKLSEIEKKLRAKQGILGILGIISGIIVFIEIL